MAAIVVVDLQLPAIVLVRLRKEKSDREIGADAQAGKAVAPDAVIDVLAEELPRNIPVEQRREDMQRHRRGNEQSVGGERTKNAHSELPGCFSVGRQLVVLLNLGRL